MTVREAMRLAALAGLLAWMILLPARAALAGGDWNDAQIGWKKYEDGLAEAKKAKKPICLIFYTEWCPHCKNYSQVFHDAKVVEQAKQFVMIRVDNDKEKDLAKQHAVDGAYIPRTYFLSSDGVLDPSIQVSREKYKYFYDEREPASILAAMEAALKKLK